MSRHPRRLEKLLIAFPFLLVGCSASSDHIGGGSASPLPVSITPTLDSANGMPLPLDQYLMNPDQESKVTEAQQVLLSSCVRRFGLTYESMPSSHRRDSDAPVVRVDGRYGHQSATLMEKWGYHPEGGSPFDSPSWPSVSPELATVESGSSDRTQKFGPGGQLVNGQSVPDHGCIGDGIKRLTSSLSGTVGDAKISNDLKLQTLKESQSDPRTQAVFAEWSKCMKDGGFDYPDPVAALSDPEWRKTSLPGQRELRVATTDAACRHKYNVVGIWYSVDFAYQEQAVKQNAEALAAAKASIEAQVKVAEEVLTG